jgi:hypothetical protein
MPHISANRELYWDILPSLPTTTISSLFALNTGRRPTGNSPALATKASFANRFSYYSNRQVVRRLLLQINRQL